MRVADIAWFAYEPKARRITLGERLSAVQRLEALALALAHHELGHRGNDPRQHEEARRLAEQWLGEGDGLSESNGY